MTREEKLPCSVDVLPGRASAIQATRGDGIGRLGGASSEQLWQVSQHSRSACSSRQSARSTGRQENKDGAGCSSRFAFRSTCSKDCGAHTAFSDVRRVTEPTPSQNGNGTAGFALQAGDEGEPFAQEDPLGESEEVHNSKREPTHRGGIVRRAPRESFGAEKSRGPQWLLKMSHCEAWSLCGL